MALDATALALPDASTLQALTETAVAHREERPVLAAELVVPTIQLAQQVALQLDAYGLSKNETLYGYDANAPKFSAQERVQFRNMIWEDVDAALRRRRYTLKKVGWSTGHWWSRNREDHTATVLVYEKSSLDRRPLWDPRNPSAVWDLKNPPDLDGLKGDLQWHSWCKVQLPTAAMLAHFAGDAMQMVEGVVTRESRRTAHLSAGIEHADAALMALAV